MLVSMCQNTQHYTPQYHEVPTTVCIFRRLHQDSLVWRMTWSSRERAQVATRMMKMSVLHCMKVGQVIIFSTLCKTVINP